MDLATCTPDVIQMHDTGRTEAQLMDRRSDIYPNSHAPRSQRFSCERSSSGVGSGNSTPEFGAAPPRSNIQQPPERVLFDDMFGMMAPCWRLLERAKAHMDKVNIALDEYATNAIVMPNRADLVPITLFKLETHWTK